MRAVVTLCAVTMLLAWTASAGAEDCPGNPDALGTQRVITVDPTEHPRIGTLQYSRRPAPTAQCCLCIMGRRRHILIAITRPWINRRPTALPVRQPATSSPHGRRPSGIRG